MSMQPAGFRIAASCPGCGAAVDFGADFFVTQCTHCHSPLRLILPHNSAAFYLKAILSEREARFAVDRFCKVNGESLPAGLQRKTILFPYWNVDGILLKVRNEIERREIVSEFGDESANEVVETPRQRVTLTPFSTTIPAGDICEEIPATIGLRAKYVTLYPLAADKLESGVTLVPVKCLAENAIEEALRISHALSQVATPDFGKNSNRLFPLSASLIFFPYAIFESGSGSAKRSFVIDLLSGDVTKGNSNTTNDESDTFGVPVHLPEVHQVSLSFHRCPNCGHDLSMEQSLVYLCTQCEERIMMENGIPRDVQISFIQSGLNHDDTWFPFWVLTGSQTRVMPAFRSGNYEAMFRLSQRMTGALPKFTAGSIAKPGFALAPVQVPIEEALAMVQASFARQSAGKSGKGNITVPSGEEVTAELLFVPFHREEYFYIDSCLKVVTFEQAAVKTNSREPAVKSRV